MNQRPLLNANKYYLSNITDINTLNTTKLVAKILHSWSIIHTYIH